MDATELALNIVLFGGLFALAAGYYIRDRRCHLLRILGFALLTAFFTLEVVRIVREGKDVWNVAFTAFAPPMFLFVAWQEYLSYIWDEDHRSLKWLVGTAWIAGLIYYGFDRIPVMTAGIVYVVAGQTIWLGQMFGYGADFRIEGINWGREDLSVSITNSPVSIILGCTGIEAIVIFVGAILATRLEWDPWAAYRESDAPRFVRYRLMSGRERVARSLIYTISIIWVGNLIRNVAIIYLVDVKGWDFDFVHGDLGKGSSFIILLVLAFVTFNLLPEMLDNISGLYDLRNRMSPEERAVAAAKIEESKARDGDGNGKGNGKAKGPGKGKEAHEGADGEDGVARVEGTGTGRAGPGDPSESTGDDADTDETGSDEDVEA